MYEGKTHGFGALASYLIATFCKAIMKILEEYAAITPLAQMTVNEFINKLNDLRIHLFSNNLLTDVSLEKEHEKQKKLFPTEQAKTKIGNGYGVFFKKYELNPNFIPATFHEEPQSTL